MQELLKQVDEPSRRSFMQHAASSMLGVSLLPLGNLWAAEKKDKADKKPTATAKNVIYLYMTGGMSHIDTFDPKPGRDVQGNNKPISTSVPGMKLGQHFEKLAKQMKKLAVIRSMHTDTAAHEPASYVMRTSYKEIATIRHPNVGAWAQYFLGKRNDVLPDTVLINTPARHPGAGWMDPVYSPLPIGDPNAGLQNTDFPSYLTEDAFQKRLRLSTIFDRQFHQKYKQKQVQAYDDFYAQAAKLMTSDELDVFDLNKEDAAVRDKYGRNQFGQGCLLARRLIENNVRFVEVAYGSWDMHRDLDESLEDRMPTLDQGFSALLDELQEKGMLNDTLVVLTSEFGRTPKINQNGGRDHHPAAFCSVLAGGGVRGGRYYGASDEDGFYIDDVGMMPVDLNATIAHALGLPLEKEVFSKSGRPFTVGHGGEPNLELFG